MYKVDPHGYGNGTGSRCQPQPDQAQRLEMAIQSFARDQCARGKTPLQAFKDAEVFFQIAETRSENVNARAVEPSGE